jgi:Mobilization protein NikA
VIQTGILPHGSGVAFGWISNLIKAAFLAAGRNVKAMEQNSSNRTAWLHLRLTQKEYDKIRQDFEQSTCNRISEYARTILLDRKVTIYKRNQSLDEFMEEMILLRKELNALGNNFSQVVRKINLLPEEDILLLKNELAESKLLQQTLLQKVNIIKNHINQFSDQWLQRS